MTEKLDEIIENAINADQHIKAVHLLVSVDSIDVIREQYPNSHVHILNTMKYSKTMDFMECVHRYMDFQRIYDTTCDELASHFAKDIYHKVELPFTYTKLKYIENYEFFNLFVIFEYSYYVLK
jgi:hypothetical protein